MTPLHKTAQEAIEMIATEDLSKWASRHDKVVTGALKSAIHAEQAQAVEPVAWAITASNTGRMCQVTLDHDEVADMNPKYVAPLYTHPAPPASDHVPETAFGNTERAALIDCLREHASFKCIEGNEKRMVLKAANMLEADAQDAFTVGLACQPKQGHDLSLDLLERLSKTLINLGYSTPEGGTEHFGAQIESQLYNLCRGVDSILAQQVTHYDQQALELCPECGWKAIMPGEPCFVCNMQTEAQQVAVPTGWALVPIEPTPAILDAMSSSGWKTACYKAMLAAAQGTKLVTKKDSKTDWSAA